MPVNINIPDAWTSYVTQTNLGLEVVPHVLYDSLKVNPGTVPGGGTPPNPTQFRFFQQVNVTEDLTNMKNQGMLPNPEAMLIQAIRFNWQLPMTTTMDQSQAVGLLTNSAVLTAKIGNKIYGPWPLFMLTSGSRIVGCNTGITDCFLVQNEGPLYPLFPNLMLSPLQPFIVTVDVTPQPAGNNGAKSQPNFPIADGPIWMQVMLDGQLARSIQ
jgi:hypothetical protein